MYAVESHTRRLGAHEDYEDFGAIKLLVLITPNEQQKILQRSAMLSGHWSLQRLHQPRRILEPAQFLYVQHLQLNAMGSIPADCTTDLGHDLKMCS